MINYTCKTLVNEPKLLSIKVSFNLCLEKMVRNVFSISLVTSLFSPKTAFKLTPFLNEYSKIFLVNKKSNVFLSCKERKHERNSTKLRKKRKKGGMLPIIII